MVPRRARVAFSVLAPLAALWLSACSSASPTAAGAHGTASTGTEPLSTANVAPSSPPGLHVIARDLDNPRSVVVGPDGAVYVAESGHGKGDPSTCTPVAGQPYACLGLTGAVSRVSRAGRTRILSGLPSLAELGGSHAEGPAGLALRGDRLTIVEQFMYPRTTDARMFGARAAWLGHPLTVAASGRGPISVGPDLPAFERAHNPDHGAGGSDDPTDSDPYAVAPYKDGFVIVDAGANDLLFVDAAGSVTVLAVFPTITEKDEHGATVQAQAVPDSVAVGPDGAIYVGELTGRPYNLGKARVWRVVPGRGTTVYASGFTAISSLAFDRAGRLLVLEISVRHIVDPSAPGALFRLDAQKRRVVLARTGLSFPTGLAVAPDGTIYIADHGGSPSTGAGPHGQLLALRL